MTDPIFYSVVALVSASAWAMGAILWRTLGDALTPGSMNYSKVVLGSAILAIMLATIGVEEMSLRDFLLLGGSGLLGIAVGDTFFFMSLVNLGPRRASLMGTLNPVLIALSSYVVLGERPAALAWAGIVATSTGVAWVLYERSPNKEDDVHLARGALYGGLSIVCTTMSVLAAKVGVVSTPTVQATLVRLLWAVVGMTAWGLVRGHLRTWAGPFTDSRLLVKVVMVVALVVLGGFWLSLVALKHLDASIAGTLNSTAPLLILPMVIVVLKEKVSLRAFLGALVAVAGISLIMVTR